MSDPLATWKGAKTTFEAKVKNNKNTRKPGSWFTTGTDSAIKKVIAIVYDGKQPPAYKKALDLHEKLKVTLKKEYAKKKIQLVDEVNGRLTQECKALKQQNKSEKDIKRILEVSKALLIDSLREALAFTMLEHELKIAKSLKKCSQVFDDYIMDLKKQHQTQLIAWRKHMADYQKQLNDANKSKDYDADYKKALPILEDGLKAVDKELAKWPDTNWEAFFSCKKEDHVDYDD